MNIKLNLLVLRCQDINKTKSFYEKLGLVFQLEKHGNGPEHYCAKLNKLIFELYPLKEGEASDHSRLGFQLTCESRLREELEAKNISILSNHTFEQQLVFVIQDPDGRKVEISEA